MMLRLYSQLKNHHKELCEESWKPNYFFILTEFKDRDFLIYKYILGLTEALEYKSFINICWVSELISESLRTIWRKHYNSFKSQAELWRRSGWTRGPSGIFPRGRHIPNCVLAPRRPSSLVMFHTGQDLRKSSRNKGKPAQVGLMAQEHRWTNLHGMEPKSQEEMEIIGCA